MTAVTASTARSTSSRVAPPVDTIMRLAERGNVTKERRVSQVAGSDLVRGSVELLEQVGARLVERRREEDEPELARARLQLDVGAAVELERLAVRAVRRAEAVLVVVGAVVERAREQAPVVALLELYRVDARLLREDEQLLCLLDRALVVVADLRDHEAVGVVGDPASVDRQLAHRAMVPLRSRVGAADTQRVSSDTTVTVPPMATSLSILMPVYDELATVERAIDDALTAELPVESRQLVIVDDGSTDGTRELLRERVLAGHRDARVPRQEPWQGRSAPHGSRARDRGVVGGARRRSRVPRVGSRAAARTAPRGAGTRRLRHPLVVEPFRVQLLVRDGQQGRHARDERDLQLLDLGRDDVPQGDEDGALPLADASGSEASRSSRRSPRGCCALASGSTRCRSPTRPARARRARS